MKGGCGCGCGGPRGEKDPKPKVAAATKGAGQKGQKVGDSRPLIFSLVRAWRHNSLHSLWGEHLAVWGNDEATIGGASEELPTCQQLLPFVVGGAVGVWGEVGWAW